MCGRVVVLPAQKEEFEEATEVEVSDPGLVIPSGYNLSPSAWLAVVTDEQPRTLSVMQWGMTPHWATKQSNGNNHLGKSETLLEKPTFRVPFQQQRCLVPVSGFYEWVQGVPWFIHNQNREPMVLAGVWDTWHDRKKEIFIRSFAIVTCEPNLFMTDYQDRMPVRLGKEQQSIWLDPRTPLEVLHHLMQPFTEDVWTAHEAHHDVGKSSNDGAYLLVPDPNGRPVKVEKVKQPKKGAVSEGQLSLF